MKNAEGYRFMKAGQRKGGPRNGPGHAPLSHRSNYDEAGGAHSARFTPGHRPSFDQSSNGGAYPQQLPGGPSMHQSSSSRKLQPWNNLAAVSEDSQQHQQMKFHQRKGAGGPGRRPSDFVSQQSHTNKPYSGLAATDG